MDGLAQLTDRLWNPWLLGLFLLTGLWFSLRTGFFQIFQCRRWWRQTVGTLLHADAGRHQNGISQVQALSTALAATIGTGSIAGVATAIFYGGPGAVFWMWVCALLGMMTGCAEKALTIRYREPDGHGGWRGGPMYYMEKALHCKPLARLFALLCLGETLVGAIWSRPTPLPRRSTPALAGTGLGWAWCWRRRQGAWWWAASGASAWSARPWCPAWRGCFWRGALWC